MKCEWPNYECNRQPVYIHGEFGDLAACHGHSMIFQANADSHGLSLMPEDKQAKFLAQLMEQYKEARQWLKDHPNPKEDIPSSESTQ